MLRAVWSLHLGQACQVPEPGHHHSPVKKAQHIQETFHGMSLTPGRAGFEHGGTLEVPMSSQAEEILASLRTLAGLLKTAGEEARSFDWLKCGLGDLLEADF